MKKKIQVKLENKIVQTQPKITRSVFIAQKINPQARFNPAHFKTQHRG